MSLPEPRPDLAAIRERLEKALSFARKVIDASRDGDVEMCDVQDWAVEAGLLIPTQVTEACGENCVCAECDDFPQTCYRLSEALAAAQEEAR